MGEVRHNVVTQDGENGSREEVVSRPDANRKLEEVSRTVTKESGGGAQKRETVESYSADVPGSPGMAICIWFSGRRRCSKMEMGDRIRCSEWSE